MRLPDVRLHQFSSRTAGRLSAFVIAKQRRKNLVVAGRPTRPFDNSFLNRFV